MHFEISAILSRSKCARMWNTYTTQEVPVATQGAAMIYKLPVVLKVFTI